METDLARLIKGHPSVPLIRGNGLPDKQLIVCSSCGEIKDLLVLAEDSDRYRCLACGGSGPIPTQHAVTNPRASRRR